MNHCVGCSLYSFKCSLDDMLSCLCQYLDRYIIRNHVFFDQGSHKLIFCLGSSRESNLDLLKSNIYQHLEKLQLFIQTHRLDQCLISITQINAAPDWRCVYIIFFHPVIFKFRRHKILSLVFFTVFHFVSLLLFNWKGRHLLFLLFI